MHKSDPAVFVQPAQKTCPERKKPFPTKKSSGMALKC